MTLVYYFFFKQKTAYEMRISDWSSDVCSSDLGSQRVVVAKTDFVGDDGVVLVDDRYHAQVQQRVEGGTGVQVPAPVGEVFMGEQNLRRSYAMGGKRGFVCLDQPHLPDRRRRL